MNKEYIKIVSDPRIQERWSWEFGDYVIDTKNGIKEFISFGNCTLNQSFFIFLPSLEWLKKECMIISNERDWENSNIGFDEWFNERAKYGLDIDHSEKTAWAEYLLFLVKENEE